jgi:outer membrane receptor protein involved in Fe transport
MGRAGFGSRSALACIGVSLAALSTGAFAQASVPTPDVQQPPVDTDATSVANPAVTTTSNANATDADEIVVTAQKREQSLNDVGLTVSVLGSEQLANQGIRTSEDLARAVSALTVAEAADGTPVYTLRGVGFNSPNLGAQPTVSVYIDEAGLPYGPLTQGPIFDLERVEVLKGPQGTLFGQNSTGGAINYIAAKPSDKFAGGVSLGYGRFNTFQGDAYVTGPLTDTLSARLAVTGTRSGDWQYNYLRDDSIGKTKRAAGRLLLGWKPTQSLKISLNLNGWIDQSDNQIPQFLAAAPRVPAQAVPELFTIPAPPHNVRAADWDPGKPFDRDNKLGQAVLRADLDLNDNLTLTSLTNYIAAKIDSQFDADGTRFSLGDITTTGKLKVFTQELRLGGEFGSGNYLVGVNYQKDHIREDTLGVHIGQSAATNVLSPPLPPPGLGTITGVANHGIQSNQSTGVFGNLEFEITDRLTAVGGARYTWLKHRNQACSADTGAGDFVSVINKIIGLISGTQGNLLPGECITLNESLDNPFEKQNFKENNLSWRAGLNYQLAERTLLYGLVSRGFKSGNYPVINATSRAQFTPVRQEQLTAYELGIKTNFNRVLQLNLAGYYYDYKDKQLLTQFVDPLFGLLPILANVPKSRVVGFDAEAVLKPTRGLTWRAAVGYANTRIDKFAGYDAFSQAVDLSGKSFNYSPRWTGNTDVEYRFPVASRYEAFLGADATYNSQTYSDLAQSAELKIKPYTLLGLRAGIADPDNRWQAMVWARNVTNEYYWTNAVIGIDTIYRLTGQPRTYGVSLGLTF